MTQRQVDHPSPLPPCKAGHAPRHFVDARRESAGGGHFIECPCGRTQKHASYPAALREWVRINGAAAPAAPRDEPSNVVQMGLRLTGCGPS